MRTTRRAGRAAGAALTAALMALSGAAGASAAPENGWDPLVPDVVIAQASDGKRFHFPNAERLDDGSLVVVAREGFSHVGQEGRIVMARSHDGGMSWTAPEVVVDTPVDDRDPMITQTSSGRLLLSYFQIDYSVATPEVLGTSVVRSDDLGQTWSAPTLVGTSLSGDSDVVDGYELGWAASHGQIKQVADGRLLIPLYGTTPDDPWQRATVVRSEDDGLTWEQETESLIASDQGTDFQEPVLTVLRDGSVVALLRLGAGGPLSRISRSDDGGRTWSEPEETDLPTSSAHTEVLANGDVFLAYGDLSRDFTPRRATVGAIIQHPEGTWSDPPRDLVYDSGTGDQANPAVVEVSPGRVLVVGFDYVDRTLVGTFVRAAEILQPEPEVPDPSRLDLLAMSEAGQLEVSTDMTYTNPSFPAVGPLGAIDGVVAYASAAWAPKPAPATYEIHFTEPMRPHEVGIALKPGYAESAVVETSLGGGPWQAVATLDYRVRGDDLEWMRLPDGEVDRVRVRLLNSDGWAVLAEVALRGPQQS